MRSIKKQPIPCRHGCNGPKQRTWKASAQNSFSFEVHGSKTQLLARFLGSTPLLSESSKICGRSNVMAPQGFLIDEVAGVTYVVFSGVQLVEGLVPPCGILVPLSAASDVSPFSGDCYGGMFSVFQNQRGENTTMVDVGLRRNGH
ncbi:hypothetical protein L2E82_01727 [Cichorium intybus]|uniref:Uncharacterized protein n=1 Tax=Cichorium intybus TaxID=13427 RepID=A0ACB9GZT1_CICIN|nr:hypothetical protein L2E82_01727 [Cichorium intybus]